MLIRPAPISDHASLWEVVCTWVSGYGWNTLGAPPIVAMRSTPPSFFVPEAACDCPPDDWPVLVAGAPPVQADRKTERLTTIENSTRAVCIPGPPFTRDLAYSTTPLSYAV